jgi:hypothetical protein
MEDHQRQMVAYGALHPLNVSVRICFGSVIAEAVRHGRSLALDDGRFFIARGVDKREHIVMSYKNGS